MYDKYNPDDMSEGFSRRYYLVRVSTTLFLPSDTADVASGSALYLDWTGLCQCQCALTGRNIIWQKQRENSQYHKSYAAYDCLCGCTSTSHSLY